MKHLLKKGELDNSSKPNQIKDQRRPAREKHHGWKERTVYSSSGWCLQIGDVDHDDDDNDWEPVEPITVLGVLRVKCQKASLNRWPIACTGGGGARFSPNTSHVIQKWSVNATLMMGYQADPAHC